MAKSLFEELGGKYERQGGGIIRKMKSQGHFLSFFKASPTSE